MIVGMNDLETLGEALPKEMARVRDEVLPAYLEIGKPGMLAVLLMRRDLEEAAVAMRDGDVVRMIRIYQILKEIE